MKYRLDLTKLNLLRMKKGNKMLIVTPDRNIVVEIIDDDYKIDNSLDIELETKES